MTTATPHTQHIHLVRLQRIVDQAIKPPHIRQLNLSIDSATPSYLEARVLERVEEERVRGQPHVKETVKQAHGSHQPVRPPVTHQGSSKGTGRGGKRVVLLRSRASKRHLIASEACLHKADVWNHSVAIYMKKIRSIRTRFSECEGTQRRTTHFHVGATASRTQAGITALVMGKSWSSE